VFSLQEYKERKLMKKYDKEFLAAIQPQGGVSFHEKYIKKGDGYETVVHLYGYPTVTSDFWLAHIVNMKDVIVTIDVSTEKRSVAISKLNDEIREQNNRMYSDSDQVSRHEASNAMAELQMLYDQLSRMGEVLKLIHVRLYIHGKTAMELEQKVKEVLEELEGSNFQGTIFLNEMEYEWRSLFLPYKEQLKMFNKREGKGLSAFALAGSYPFNFSSLSDPYGTYLGQTFTGGNVLFDIFHKDSTRAYYNGVLVGTMGAGKSTLLKKLLLDNYARGNLIRGFDVTGEFETLIREINGHMVSLDGSQGIINPLQVLKTSENEHESFMIHMSKLSMFYHFLSPNATDEDIKEFEKVLRGLYVEKGLYDKIKTTGITTLNEKEYPTFSDFLNYVRKELYVDFENRKIRPQLSRGRIERLEKIELTLENLVDNYGYLFDGHTTIENVMDQQVVFYSIRNLTSLKKEIFNAQMFNALTLIWDNMLRNGKPQYDAIYEGKLKFEDAVRLLLIIDEAHRIINSNNLLAVKYLIDFAREARKYLGGLLFASQSIRDVVPEATSTEVMEAIKTLFELTIYKFIMKQDTNALGLLSNVFNGQLSESELKSIPQLETGDCILAINGVGNISFHVEASEEELALFRGGF